MKRMLAWCGGMVLASSAMAVSYANDFEGETNGTLPNGWTVVGWGEFAPGPFTAVVADAPGGGKALKMEFGTDWSQYGASSGEAHYGMDTTGIDTTKGFMRVNYDFYKQNWRTWMAAGDNGGWPGAAFIHMNDDPAKPNHMVVGSDSYDDVGQLLTDVPENAWIHVDAWNNMVTGDWRTRVSYNGVDHIFTGNYTPDELWGEYFFGGWAFKSTMDSGYGDGLGVYANALYVDNFEMKMEAVPEPATLTALGLGVAFLLRKRRPR